MESGGQPGRQGQLVMRNKKSEGLGPGFNRLWSASILTNLADGVLSVAAPLLAITLTKDPVLIALLSAMISLPWLLFAIPIGLIVDLVDKRHLIAITNTMRFLIAAFLALSISTNRITIYWLLVAAFLIGICEVAADTAAQSLIPVILEKQNFERANSRLNISESVIQGFVGAPLSGFLYSAAIFLPFAFNSLGFAMAAVFVLLIPVHLIAPTETLVAQKKDRASFLSEIKFGLKHLWKDKDLRGLVSVTTSMGFFFSLAMSTIVLFATETLKIQPRYFGVVMAIIGSGGILGALVAPKLSKRFGRGRVLAVSIVFSSLSTLAGGLAPDVWFYIAISFLSSVAISTWNVLLMSCYQVLIPKEIYGRIHGARRTFVWGIMPIGAFCGGVIANTGLRSPLIIGGIGTTIISVAAFSMISRIGAATSEEVSASSSKD